MHNVQKASGPPVLGFWPPWQGWGARCSTQMGLSTGMGKDMSYLGPDKGSCQVSEPKQSLHWRRELIHLSPQHPFPEGLRSQPLDVRLLRSSEQPTTELQFTHSRNDPCPDGSVTANFQSQPCLPLKLPLSPGPESQASILLAQVY